MKVITVFIAFVAVASASMPEERRAAYINALSQRNSLQPEWHMPKPEGNGLVGLSYESDDHMHNKAIDDAKNAKHFHGSTTDEKDRYDVQLGQFDTKGENINMTPYVIQTKDERWEAGVPNYMAPEEGYTVRTFDLESAARTWVIQKTGADNTINYPMAPDVDPENNPANPVDPNDHNPNVMQDNAPKDKPKVQMGHMEPAYIGEYDPEAIFGNNIKGADHVAHGEASGDLQDEVYLQLRARRARANRHF